MPLRALDLGDTLNRMVYGEPASPGVELRPPQTFGEAVKAKAWDFFDALRSERAANTLLSGGLGGLVGGLPGAAFGAAAGLLQGRNRNIDDMLTALPMALPVAMAGVPKIPRVAKTLTADDFGVYLFDQYKTSFVPKAKAIISGQAAEPEELSSEFITHLLTQFPKIQRNLQEVEAKSPEDLDKYIGRAASNFFKRRMAAESGEQALFTSLDDITSFTEEGAGKTLSETRAGLVTAPEVEGATYIPPTSAASVPIETTPVEIPPYFQGVSPSQYGTLAKAVADEPLARPLVQRVLAGEAAPKLTTVVGAKRNPNIPMGSPPTRKEIPIDLTEVMKDLAGRTRTPGDVLRKYRGSLARQGADDFTDADVSVVAELAAGTMEPWEMAKLLITNPRDPKAKAIAGVFTSLTPGPKTPHEISQIFTQLGAIRGRKYNLDTYTLKGMLKDAFRPLTRREIAEKHHIAQADLDAVVMDAQKHLHPDLPTAWNLYRQRFDPTDLDEAIRATISNPRMQSYAREYWLKATSEEAANRAVGNEEYRRRVVNPVMKYLNQKLPKE